MRTRIAALLVGVWLPFSAAALDYSEAVSGDVPSSDELEPTPLGAVSAGANVVSGSFAVGSDSGDVFSIDVPANLTITDIVLKLSAFSGEFPAALKLFTTPVFTTLDYGTIYESGTYPSIATPLPGGASYGFTATVPNSVMAPASYAWQWTITAPEPGPGLASLAAAAALVTSRRARG